MSKNFIFTSEAVSMGHPDKVSDQISDGVLDALLAQDPNSRCACETLCTTDYLCLAGEIRTSPDISKDEVEKIARNVVREIGYTSDDIGFNADTCKVDVLLHQQSADIAMGVDADGAGDQGLMFGYACDQTEELMPLPIALSHRILNHLNEKRFSKDVDWLLPDSKSQVSVRYGNGKPAEITAIVLSTQHRDSVKRDEIEAYIRETIIPATVPSELLNASTKYHVNPTGQFLIGGPHGDCGLTGRKIIVDTYGGWGRHGGGAFSGKDSTKVDRSAAYMARYVAKNIVAAGLATECEVQLAYAIGVVDPVSIRVDSNGTSTVDESRLEAAVRKVFPLNPQGIIDHLQLRRPVFRQTAEGGHFGRKGEAFTWENTDKVEDLKAAVAG
ncbi:methionine adenosyltransferase [Thalassoglobus sp. JC818]|uniref:methionine adenosyltransferase n=1 Tax=Thalassoglobus sp. JC818 TaxID=3232136 RepID=UPI00345A1E7D